MSIVFPEFLLRSRVMENEKEIVLYYPYIDIDDESLIKTAALYWDGIQTIVPYDEYEYYDKHGSLPSHGTDPYATPISKEAKAAGFLNQRFVNPDDEPVKQAGREIITDIRKTPEIKTKIKEMIIKPFRPSQRKRQKFSKLSLSKIDVNHLLNIAFEFKEAGIPISAADYNYVIVPTPFSDTYMSMLASSIAANDGTIPLTNVNIWHHAMLDRYVNYDQKRKVNQAQLADLSLRALAVDPEVPLIDVLRFRDKNRDKLIKYRRLIRRLVRDISGELDTNQKQVLFEEIVKNEILPEKEDIEAKLKSESTFFTVSITVITVTAIGTILLSGGQAWLGGLLQGAATIGLNYYGNVRTERIIKDHPLGYLYKAQQRLGIREKN